VNDLEVNKTVMMALKCVRELNKRITPPIVSDFYYGDMKMLHIWYIFADHAARAVAETDGHCARIQQQTLEALREAGFPSHDLDSVQIGFEGDKEIMKGGGYYAYFK
jgi:hypothetical protein